MNARMVTRINSAGKALIRLSDENASIRDDVELAEMIGVGPMTANAWHVLKVTARPGRAPKIREVATYLSENEALIERHCLQRRNRKANVRYVVDPATLVGPVTITHPRAAS